MGLIQTVDQLKFSYMAIAEGARQAELISSDSPALSAILPPKSKVSGSTTVYASARALDSSSSSDSSSDFDYGLGPPPLPPPRSESLLASNSNMTAEQRLHQQQNQQVYVNGNDGSGPGLLLPADIAEQIEAYNDMPQSLTAVYGHTDSASLSEPNQNLDTNIISNELKDDSISGSLHPEGPTVSASPTKQYILNNHKLEERKRYFKCLKGLL